MRWLKYLALGLTLLAALAAAGGWLALRSEAFWTWGAQRLVAFAQDRLYPTLMVQEVQGHPLTGLTFRGVRLVADEGEILRAERLELQFSLWSFIRLRPIICRVALFEPHLSVWWQPDGEANVQRVFRPRHHPPLRSLDFTEILVIGAVVEVRKNGETARYGPLDFQGAVTVLNPKLPEQSVLVRRASLSYAAPQGRLKLATRLTVSQELLNILDLEAKLEEALLARASGQCQLQEEPTACLSLEVGPAPGDLLRRLLPAWPAAWPLHGKFRLDLSRTAVKAAGSGQLREAPFTLAARLARETEVWRYELNLDTPALQAELLAPWRPSWAERLRDLPPVPARLVGQGTGLSWPPAALDWNLQVGAVNWRGVRLQAGQAAISGSHREQTLKLMAQGSFGKAAATLSGPLLTEAKGEARLEVEDFRPEVLGLAVPAGTQASGRLTGAWRLPRWDLEALAFSGELTARGRLGEVPVQEVSARLAWERPRLAISRGALRAGHFTAEVSGAVSASEANLRLTGNLTGPPPLLPPVRVAQAAFNLTLAGPWRQSQAVFAAEARGLAWQDLAAQSLALKGTLVGWPFQSGGLTAQATGLRTPVVVFPRASFTAQGEGYRWRLQGRAGQADRQVELAGLLETGSRPLNLTLARLDFKLGKLSGGALGPVRLAFAPGFRLEPATVQVNGGRVAAEARLEQGAVAARLEARDLPGELLSLKGVPLQGKVEARAALHGGVGNPVLESEFTLGQGRWGRLEFKALKAKASYGDGALRLSGALEERRGSRLSLEGRLPWRFVLQPFAWRRGDEELSVRLQGENLNLGILAALTREVSEADIPAEFQAEWRGPAAQPRVSGFFRWGEGNITFRLGGARYQVAAGAARLEGNTLTIPAILFHSQGEARVNGTITLEGFFPARVDLRGQLQDFKALSRYGSEAVGQGSLTLAGPFNSMLLKGQLTVTRAVFRPIFFESGTSEDIVLIRRPEAKPGQEGGDAGPPEFIRNAQMHISLEGANNIWVRDKRANIELGGRLLATKEAGGPVRLRGDLAVLQGTVTVHDKPFKVVQGAVHLPGRPPEFITLQGRAEHQLEDVRLILEMSGPAAKPEIRLSSIPPQPPADLLAYMAFGQRAASLTKEQYSSVTSQAVGLIGGLTTKKLLDFLGKDFPLLGDIYLTSGPQTVGVGKPLTKDLSVSFERTTDPLARYYDENQVRLQYRVRRGVTVESQFGRRNSGVDVFWNFDF